jgi:hypothetical protein
MNKIGLVILNHDQKKISLKQFTKAKNKKYIFQSDEMD